MIAIEPVPDLLSAHARVDDRRVRRLQEIQRPVDLLTEAPISPDAAALVCHTRGAISRILAGDDPRLLAIVGPCSVHNVDATLAYGRHLAELARAYADSLLVVMRVYFEKPRTRSGWKGLINDPYLDDSFHIDAGLRIARRLLLSLNAMGLPTATEFVDPITPQYIGDLISWAAIGARTTESQVHRELASGLSCPVGFKNGTSGDIRIAVNAVLAAAQAHHFLGVTKFGTAAIVSTTGNADCHVILRGGVRPNYDRVSVEDAAALLAAEGVRPRLMVDCSHGNCEGDYRRQLDVAAEIARRRREGCDRVFGVMVESNLIGGRQPFVAGTALVPGLSITDPCLGIDDTAALLDLVSGEEARCC